MRRTGDGRGLVMSEVREALAGIVDVINGPPSLLDMAKTCQGDDRLRGRESDFVNSMVLLSAGGREPTPKQACWLRAIFRRIEFGPS